MSFPGSNTAPAVLLLNLGGPDSLEAVGPFLYNLFSDREIIRLGPPFLQKPLARLIASLRSAKTRAAYRLIGGRSPIREITSAQAAALAAVLPGMKVFVGMRYWEPYIEDAVGELLSAGVRRLIVLSLYPQYSVATTGSSVAHLKRILAGRDVELRTIGAWHDHPRYIDALAAKVKAGLAAFGDSGKVHVLFSAHSLPKKFIDEGDPYQNQTEETVRLVAERVRVPWSLSYQSKSGPVAWLEPSTEAMIEHLARDGVKQVLAVPVSFVSDHIETLYEIDILYRNMAARHGIRLERAESLNTDPVFIDSLKEIVLAAAQEAGWRV
ncbi:MAG: ferrochelatase [Thermodesulfovibrionales bacterium]